MKDIICLGSLSISLFFQIKNPENFNLGIVEFEKNGKKCGSSEHFQSYLNFVSHIGRKVWQRSGEEEANIALALARMGFNVGFMGKVGEDKFGDFLIESLVDLDTSRIKKGGFTGVRMVLLTAGESESRLVFRNANDSFTYEDADIPYLNKTPFLHMSPFIGDISLETQKRVVEEINSSVKISLRIGRDNANQELHRIIPLINKSYILFLDNYELKSLNVKEYPQGIKELLDYGPKNIVCKVENKGWHIASKDEDFFIPIQKKRDHMERSNSIDFFLVGFLASSLIEKSLYECALIAAELETRYSSVHMQKSFPDKELLDMILIEKRGLKD